MTLEEFKEELKALLKRTQEAGLDSNQVVEIAEFILSDSWD